MIKIIRSLRNYLVPHPENDHKPHFFSSKSIAGILVVLIGVEFVFLAQVFFVFKKTGFLAAVLPGVLINLTNVARAQNNTQALTTSQLLTDAANKKAQDMASKGYFSHISPDGKTPWYWLDSVGYLYGYAGENLAVNFNDSDEVLNAWMQSPTHRANIVKKEYTQIGIGIAVGQYKGRSATFVVQYFATPASRIAQPVKNNLSNNAAAVGILNSGLFNYMTTAPNWMFSNILLGVLLLVLFATSVAFLLRKKGNHHYVLKQGFIILLFVIIIIFINKQIIPSVTINDGNSQDSSIFRDLGANTQN